jgi:protein SCO1/2
MRPRRIELRTAALVIASALAVGIVAGVLIHFLPSGGDSDSPDTAAGLHGQAIWEPGQRIAPDFWLPDQSGRPVSLASLRGRNVMLAFFSSRCRLACAREARTLRIALALLSPPARPALVIVSLDPAHDTPESVRAALARWGLATAAGRHWLLGSREELAPVWAAYRVGAMRAERPAAGKTPVYLIDRNGFERAGLLYPFPPGWPAGDLRILSRER